MKIEGGHAQSDSSDAINKPNTEGFASAMNATPETVIREHGLASTKSGAARSADIDSSDGTQNIKSVDFNADRRTNGDFKGSFSFVNTGGYFKDWQMEIKAPFDIKQIENAEIVSRDGDTYVIRATRANDDVFAGEKTTVRFTGSHDGSDIPDPVVTSFQQGTSGHRGWVPTSQIQHRRDQDGYWVPSFGVPSSNDAENPPKATPIFKKPVPPTNLGPIYSGGTNTPDIGKPAPETDRPAPVRQQPTSGRGPAPGNVGNLSDEAMFIGFENHQAGQAYTRDRQSKDLRVAFSDNDINKISQITTEESGSGNQSLKITYPDDVRANAGTAFMIPERDEYYFQYKVKFEEGFDFDGDTHSGGKLPGLAADGWASGGQDVTGSNGFTSRYMWDKGGRAKLYLYHMDKPTKWGENMFFKDSAGKDVFFEPGQWHTITQRVEINDGNQRNGEIDVWMDGEQVLNVEGIRFVNDGSGINSMFLSTFFGGNSKGFLPDRDVSAYFDDMIISTNKRDVGL